MRMMLALMMPVFAMSGAAGPLICHSGCVGRAESAAPAPNTHPGDSGAFLIPVEHQLAKGQFESVMRALRQLDYGRPNKPRQGDFWTRDEIKRHFGRP